jgi:mannose-6-phosphate isomerase-like protein (cupin superfamily)
MPSAQKAAYVPAGADRHGENKLMIWGFVPMETRVATSDTGGSLFVFTHTDMPKGGPPRHVHHEQDEWFYAVKGEFVMEVGDEKFRLKPGDSLLAPRRIPHAWACVVAPGTLITALTPAGTFETFIRDTTKHATLPPPEEINKAFAAHGMTVVGPPLDVH